MFPAAQTALKAPLLARLFSSAPPKEAFDVVIVGGGMVGASLACALGSGDLTSQLKVAVLDHATLKDDTEIKPGSIPDIRVSTLTPASARFLMRGGAWEEVAPPKSSRFSKMQVWDSGADGFVRYDASEVRAQDMGYVAENWLIQAAAVRRLRSGGRMANVTVVEGARVEGLELPAYVPTGATRSDPSRPPGPFAASVLLEGGRSFEAKLVVAADGAGSRIRQLAGIRTTGRAYPQHGVVFTVEVGPPSPSGPDGLDAAWQRFTPSGPLALLPVRDGYMNVVWSTDPEHAKRLEKAAPEVIADEVNEALRVMAPHPGQTIVRRALGGRATTGPMQDPPLVLRAVGAPPRSFPLQNRAAGKYVRQRLALVGDAAHAVHPLAGQGVNLGLADAERLAAALETALGSGGDIGDQAMLERDYESPRMKSNRAFTAAVDGLQRLFSAPGDSPLALLRSAGLDLVDASGPYLKHGILRVAMGEVDPLEAPLEGLGGQVKILRAALGL